MIKIKRHTAPEEIFGSYDLQRGNSALLEWLRRSPDARAQRRAPIDEDIFYSGELLSAVSADFQGRCAFCESNVDSRDAVHHFRPLGDAEPTLNTPSADYYVWLAFEWLNLFWVCRPCAKAKGSFFPVEGARGTLLTPIEDLRRYERNLIIDPTREAPSRHFRFLLTGHCLPLTSRGRVTVQTLHLNREELIDRRQLALRDVIDQFERAFRDPEYLNPNDLLWRADYRGARVNLIRRIFGDSDITAIRSTALRGVGHQVMEVISQGDTRIIEHLEANIQLIRDTDPAAARIAEVNGDRGERRYEYDVTAAAPIEAPRTLDREIRTITIRNFRAIDDLELTLPPHRGERSGAPCLMLLGENAVGKSSALAAIALALVGTRHSRRMRLTYGDLARSQGRASWNQLSGEPVVAKVTLHDSRETGEYILHESQKGPGGTSEPATIVLGYGPHRYIAKPDPRVDAGFATSIRSLFDPTRPIAHPGPWLSGLNRRRFNVVAKAIRDILPIGDEDELVNDQDFGVCVFAHGQLTPIERLSEGYRSVFAMVVDIMRVLLDHWPNLETARAVVLIDEIETHLHPRWKMRLMSSLRRALPGVQFIATTHDPLCLRGMDDGEVIVLQRDEEGRIQILEDLPSIAGMRAEQLLTSEFFGLASTTDPELELALVRLAQSDRRELPGFIDDDVSALIGRLTIGDTAAEQALHEGIRRFLVERERPRGDLAKTARMDAVEAVIAALQR